MSIQLSRYCFGDLLFSLLCRSLGGRYGLFQLVGHIHRFKQQNRRVTAQVEDDFGVITDLQLERSSILSNVRTTICAIQCFLEIQIPLYRHIRDINMRHLFPTEMTVDFVAQIKFYCITA